MSVRFAYPADEAAAAAYDAWREQFRVTLLPKYSDLTLANKQPWREIAMAAVVACDMAQPARRHTPLYTDREVIIRYPWPSLRNRLLRAVLRRLQERDQRRHP